MKEEINLSNKSIFTRILYSVGLLTTISFALVITLASFDLYKALLQGYVGNYWLDVQYNASALSSIAQKTTDTLEDLRTEFFRNQNDISAGFGSYAEQLLEGNPNFKEVYLIMRDPQNDKGVKAYTWTFSDDEGKKVSVQTEVAGKAQEIYQGIEPDIPLNKLEDTYEGLSKVEDHKLYSVQLLPLVSNGEFLGLVGFAPVWDLTQMPLFLEKNYKTTDYFLVGTAGFLIYSSDNEELSGKSLEESPHYRALSSFIDIPSFTATNVKDKVIHSFSDEDTGEEYLYAASSVPQEDLLYVVRIAQKELFSPIRSLLFKVIAISIVGIALTCLILYWVVLSITTPMKNAVRIVKTVASGDLSHRVKVRGSDEVAELLRSIDFMNVNLSGLVGTVKSSSRVLSSTATDLEQTSEIQKKSVSHFGQFTKDVVTRATKINKNAMELADTMDQVAKVAADTANYAGEGRKNMRDIEKAMNKLEHSIGKISDSLVLFEERVGSIGTVSATISQVANHTNLLSLNAAIEAEKAGEAGSGFGVVATEIRRLADQTATATTDIDYIVKEAQEGVQEAVGAITTFTQEVHQGINDVERLGGGFVKIIEKVEKLEKQYSKVNQGMREQSHEAQAINALMSDLKEVATKAALTLEDLDEATRHMIKAAEGLDKGVTYFKLPPKDIED
ncbi:MAG: methyl-accepting chemotaxis protein [Chlamydiota bacterium]